MARVKFPHLLGLVAVDTDGALPAVSKPVVRNVPRALLESKLPDWKIVADREGTLKKVAPLTTVDNIRALGALTGWGMRYNEMTKRVELAHQGIVIPADDHENTALTLFVDCVIRAGMSRTDLAALVDAVATTNRVHPVEGWVRSKPWDGITRRHLWHETLVLQDSRKTGLRGKLMDKWALQCIGALLEERGISSPGILVLSGGQYIGKSYWFRNLCPISDAIGGGLNLDPSNKDSILKATRFWIAELGELDSTTRKSDVSELKAFLSENSDTVRLPYARRDTVFRRRTVFGGTVNGTGFLVDDTGNRRFWVFDVVRCDVLTPEVMQQVWAEYLAMYLAGHRWHLEPETLAELNASNIDHTAIDPLRERIATGFDWAGVEWGTIDPANHRAYTNVRWMSATDICTKVGIDRPSKAESTRAGGIVRDLHRTHGVVGQGNLERKSNGVKLLAVPAARNGGT